MDAPPIPRLVDLVHAFNRVVVEQFEKRVEKLPSDSTPLWRLLKLLFKILQQFSPALASLIEQNSFLSFRTPDITINIFSLHIALQVNIIAAIAKDLAFCRMIFRLEGKLNL